MRRAQRIGGGVAFALVGLLMTGCASTRGEAASCVCREGRAQSPIVLDPATPGSAPPVSWRVSPGQARLVRKGTNFEVHLNPAPTLLVGDEVFNFVEFHFHSPREHQLAGTQALMELHLVHANAVGELAVLGVFLKAGSANGTIQAVWDRFNSPDPFAFDPSPLFPTGRTFLRYAGSLTTGECAEGVHWFVYANPHELSAVQAQAYFDEFGRNSRDPQPRNNRPVLRVGG